jgi:hypothetical protein
MRIGGILANNKKVWWKRRREKRAFTRFRLIYVSADCRVKEGGLEELLDHGEVVNIKNKLEVEYNK